MSGHSGSDRRRRNLFSLYRELGTVRRLKDAVDQGWTGSKRRSDRAGKPFTRGHLYQLLAKLLYVGDVAHKGTIYSGQHEPIIDRETWDAVQYQLTVNRAAERSVVRHAMIEERCTTTDFDVDDISRVKELATRHANARRNVPVLPGYRCHSTRPAWRGRTQSVCRSGAALKLIH